MNVGMERGSQLGLALSGGGFRATFFHLGLIRFLRDAELLQHVTHICSVSGGSILAAHMVQNWPQYNGTDREFEAAAQDLVGFAQSDVRGRIIRRWLLSRVLPFFRRTALLQKYYSQLFRQADLGALGGTDPQDRRPELHIIATSMTTGQLCSFNQQGFWVEQEGASKLLPKTLLPLGLAVAASSAFPPLFPPVRLTRKMLDAAVNELPYESDYLADGGIFDNLGIRKFHSLREQLGLTLDLLVVSDAGAAFDWDVGSRFAWLVSRTARATDILMKRVGDLEQYVAQQLHASAWPVVRIGIEEVVNRAEHPFCLQEDLQRKARAIRTDLDTFSVTEINSLVTHGYCVAYKCRGLPSAQEMLSAVILHPTSPSGYLSPRLQNGLQRSQKSLTAAAGAL